MSDNKKLFFTEIDEQDDIRQGDVICKKIKEKEKEVIIEYNLIANADCDLAQKKNGKMFTCLRIIELGQYYNEYWAREKANKILEKQKKGILDAINAQIRRIDKDLQQLEEQELFTWIASSNPEEIFKTLTSEKYPIPDDTKNKINALDLLIERESKNTSVQEVMEAASIFNQSCDAFKTDMERAFLNSGGFPDYFILPELPLSKKNGFVVLLRTMSIISEKNVYKTDLDARINDSFKSFYRIGRLSDRIRYGIMQKLAFLFMRIGDHPDFETARSIIYGKAADDILGKNK